MRIRNEDEDKDGSEDEDEVEDDHDDDDDDHDDGTTKTKDDGWIETSWGCECCCREVLVKENKSSDSTSKGERVEIIDFFVVCVYVDIFNAPLNLYSTNFGLQISGILLVF